MKINVQKIQIGAENAVIVSAREWQKIKAALEELDDIAAIDRAVQGDDGTRYSIEEVEQSRLAKKYGEALMVNEPPATVKYNARSKK